MATDNSQIQRWILPKPINMVQLDKCLVNLTLQKVLCRRGINLENELAEFLTPSELPNPETHFKELKKATQRIIDACDRNEKIAICGDYDADGITSTVLLVELLSKLGGNAIPFIPSRKDDGYGLNIKMVDEININEIKLIITVDNGISAFNAIKKANALGIDLIITDHHKIQKSNLSIFALIHPEKTPKDSPYKYLAGVGIAYMLANNICNKLNYNIENTTANVFFCIGTVADMAPIIGANRKWLKECLPKINTTKNIGIRLIIKKLSINNSTISADDIGYKIAPLINAVGRIGNPKLIIDLLTNSSETTLKKLIKECFDLNKERKRITELSVKQAIILAKTEYTKNKKFLVISNREWHPGIIGIVAARIADDFNLPTAILCESENKIFRGSIRSNSHINVNLALNECSEILEAHGGHSAAAGFTIKEQNIPILKETLNTIAIRELRNCNLNKSIRPDAYLSFKDIDYDFYNELVLIGPFGMMNKAPIFWTRKCRIVDIYILKGNHLKLKLYDGTAYQDAIKWNCATTFKINDLVDIAFKIEINTWKKTRRLQLNIIDIKNYSKIIDLQLHKRNYKCQLTDDMKIQITNSKGESLISNLPISSKKANINQEFFSEKILAFAEIALGETA